MEVPMPKMFAVKRLDSLHAPSFCSLAGAIAAEGAGWSMLVAEMSLGVSGYYMLGCYLWG
jgi:hypothetical protein